MLGGHRLVSKSAIEPADLTGEAYISLTPHENTRSAVDKIFQEAGIDRYINFETSYSSITCSLVGHGLGVAIVNPIVAKDYLHIGRRHPAVCPDR